MKSFPKLILKNFVLIFAVMAISSCVKGPGPGGNASIQGKVLIQSYNSNCSVLISEYYGVDEDVYLIYGDDPSYSDRVRTGPGGVFWFPYLREGDYTIYAISETCNPIGGDTIMSQTVTISDRNETVEIEDLKVVR
jgi:hypothetical protein